MINLSRPRARSLSLLICTVVLVGGCAMVEFRDKTPVCFAPGTVATVNCFYNLGITKKISDEVVRVKVPAKVLEHNAKHGAYTALGGIIGSEVNKAHYGDAEFEIKVENPKQVILKENNAYEFRSIKGKTSLEVIGDARYPEDQGKDQGKHPDEISQNRETGIYATHSPKCCMCGTCQSGCVCPGQGSCPWCATTDLATFLAHATGMGNTVDIRTAIRLKQSGSPSDIVSERFLEYLSGSKNQGNISVKSVANYTYDEKFAPACLRKIT